jgi:hypothetical protein
MKKIPSLFERDYTGTRQVFDEVVPGCEWVIAGEGVATEKRDGTACAVINGKLHARYNRKRGKPAPEGWIPCEDAPDEQTGHWPGWVPVGDGPEHRWYREAWVGITQVDGTFELLGPKIQGNPYHLVAHCLELHGIYLIDHPPDRTFNAIRAWLIEHPTVEGIVWHHSDGRMVKIKRRDFGLPWPPRGEPYAGNKQSSEHTE